MQWQDKCAKFLERSLTLIPSSFEKYDANHISIVYFGVLGLIILKKPLPPGLEIYLNALWSKTGGFVPSMTYVNEGPHLPGTFFCLALRHMLNLPPLPASEKQSILHYIPKCQNEDGQFRCHVGGGEASLRHNYAAHAIWYLLTCHSREDHQEVIDAPTWLKKSSKYILSCQNYDGGFGDRPFDESHAGLTYCAVACLKMVNALGSTNAKLQNYLAKRENRLGGHNGRPNKPLDACYSFWVLGTLNILDGQCNQTPGVTATELYLLNKSYDQTLGGFCKVPGENSDPYHTALTLCALSLLNSETNKLLSLDPLLCLPLSAQRVH